MLISEKLHAALRTVVVFAAALLPASGAMHLLAHSHPIVVAHSKYLLAAHSQPRLVAHSQMEPLAVSEVASGLFVHTGTLALMTHHNEGAIANLGFVVGSQAVAVMDTGGSVREGLRLLAAIRARTAKPIRYVINTHVHPDHLFGNAAFENEGAVFVGHRNLPQALAARGQYYLDTYRHSMGDELLADTKIIPPTLVVADDMKLDLGGRALILKAWRAAHTDNDLTVWDEASGTLFSGDLVVTQHVPVLDGSILGWLAAMDDLALIPAKHVLPGHGPLIEDWPAALQQQRRYLEQLTKDIRSLISRGVPLALATQSAGQAERDRWELFEEYNARNATAAFAELEWE
jgi:quinoprotein relay system zinc metallohydrolase 2